MMVLITTTAPTTPLMMIRVDMSLEPVSSSLSLPGCVEVLSVPENADFKDVVVLVDGEVATGFKELLLWSDFFGSRSVGVVVITAALGGYTVHGLSTNCKSSMHTNKNLLLFSRLTASKMTLYLYVVTMGIRASSYVSE
jgi:hypothetical protein